MRIIKFLLLSFFISSTYCYSSPDFSGKWNSSQQGIDGYSFTLQLSQKNKTVTGGFCSVMRNGGKIDCGDGSDSFKNIHGEIRKKKLFVHFTDYYDPESDGTAVITKRGALLYWQIINIKGDVYVPNHAVLRGIERKGL